MMDRALPLWQSVLLSVASAGMLLLCFPPTDIGPLAWIALVPLFVALHGCGRCRQGALLGLVWGMVFFGGLHRYLFMYGTVPTMMVALLQTVPVVGAAAVAAIVLRGPNLLVRVLVVPALWVLAEWVRGSLGPLSLTFGQLGYTQHAALPLLQLASLNGVLGLSLLLALMNSAIAELIWELRRSDCAGACLSWMAVGLVLGLAILIWVLGYVRLLQPAFAPGGLRVAVVQAGVNGPKWGADGGRTWLEAYTWYTEQLMMATSLPGADPVADPRPELVVWPETALPLALNQEPEQWWAVAELARKHRIWLLVGALAVTEEGRTFNRAWLFSPEGELVGAYTKNDLVMFGEYVPGRERMPWLERYPIRPFDFTPGQGRPLLQVGDAFFGTLICFEAIFAGQSRELARRGAEFLVFLTSDAWAGESHEVFVHSYTAPFRAVETGRWVVRAATMGVSGVISPTGVFVNAVPALQAGYASARIEPRRNRTLYLRTGDWPLLAFCILMVWLAWRRRHLPSAPLSMTMTVAAGPGGFAGEDESPREAERLLPEETGGEIPEDISAEDWPPQGSGEEQDRDFPRGQ